ncbi:MAG: hypothetical protein AB7R69_05355 [Candidatus Babeliales bacterium]
MEKRFSAWQALRFGLYTFIENFGLYLLVMLSYIGTTLAPVSVIAAAFYISFSRYFHRMIETIKAADYSLAAVTSQVKILGYTPLAIVIFFTTVIFAFLSIYLLLGITRIALDLYDTNKSSVSRLFSCYNLIFSGVVGTFFYGAMIVFGLLFFIVPGIYLAVRYFFYFQFIVDKGVGPCTALRMSAELTEGIKWKIFAFGVLMSFINLFLKSPLFIIFWPFTSLVWVYVYRQLLAQKSL